MQTRMKWTAIDEGMPTKDGGYLVSIVYEPTGEKSVKIAAFEDGAFHGLFEKRRRIEAWMPFPPVFNQEADSGSLDNAWNAANKDAMCADLEAINCHITDEANQDVMKYRTGFAEGFKAANA